MMIKKTLLAGFTLALTASATIAAGEGWMTDFEAAKAKAAKENKDLLVDFTGSDWCGWCIKLVDEVFKHDPFKAGVKDKFVLVELDFPRDKSKLSEDLQKQNKALQEKYSVRGFPTILLLDAKGRPYAQTGYQAGGPEKYVAHLDELRSKREARDKAMEAAAKLEGVAKAEALVKALKELPETQLSHYQDVIDEVKKLDPEDKTGFVKKQAMDSAHQKMMSTMRGKSPEEMAATIDTFIKEHQPDGEMLKELKTMQLQIQVGKLSREKKTDEAIALIDKYISDNKLEGEDLQSALGAKMDPLLRAGQFDNAEKVVDAIIAAAPDSRAAKFAEGFKPRLAKMKADAAKKNEEAPKAPEKKEPAAAE